MASFNSVTIMGNLTRDPEMRYTPGGTAVCDVGLAVNEKYKNSAGEVVEEVHFIDVTCWGRTAELVNEYLGKGSNVLFQGKLKQDRWDDKETGKPRSKLKVVAERMTMLGKRDGDAAGASGGGANAGSRGNGSGSVRPGEHGSRPDARRGAAPPAEPVYAESQDDDDIPF